MLFLFFFSFILRLYLWHMELQLPAYTTATVTLDRSQICNLHYSLRQHQILNPLSKAGIKPASTQKQHWFLNRLSHNRNSKPMLFH